MKNKLSFALPILTLLAFIAGAIAYPHMPALVASHWNAAGEVNGYMSKFWGVFFAPLIMAGLTALALAIPKIDPRAAQIAAFRKQYDLMWLTILLFLAYVYALTLAWNLGSHFDLTREIVPGFAVLFYVIGRLLESSEQNWFIGIRTPWTMSSEVVWKKTNKLGGKLFRASAIIMLVGLAFFPSSMLIGFILVPILTAAAVSVAYSYVEFRKLK